jgi:phosphatidylserine/phosphatidylglycerophosphate/cardiolipin synthase-like enzyme
MKNFIALTCLIFAASSSLASTFKDNTAYQVCFTPYENCTGELIRQINQAQSSIYVQAFSFTSRPIAKALINAKQRGVKVLVIFDHSQLDHRHYSLARLLIKNDISVWNDDQPNIAHNKVMIIDRSIVETGSFNYTVSAQRYNTENMLIIHNAPLAERYIANWNRRMQLSQPVSAPHSS